MFDPDKISMFDPDKISLKHLMADRLRDVTLTSHCAVTKVMSHLVRS